jgi:seryl-tRNA synthetase
MLQDNEDRSKWYKKKTKDVLVADCVYLEKQRGEYSEQVFKLQSDVQELRRLLGYESSKRKCLHAVVIKLTAAITDLSAGVDVK